MINLRSVIVKIRHGFHIFLRADTADGLKIFIKMGLVKVSGLLRQCRKEAGGCLNVFQHIIKAGQTGEIFHAHSDLCKKQAVKLSFTVTGLQGDLLHFYLPMAV